MLLTVLNTSKRSKKETSAILANSCYAPVQNDCGIIIPNAWLCQYTFAR